MGLIEDRAGSDGAECGVPCVLASQHVNNSGMLTRTSTTAHAAAPLKGVAKEHKSPKRPRSFDSSLHQHDGGGGQTGRDDAMAGASSPRASSPQSASVDSPLALDMKAKDVAGGEHAGTSRMTRVVRPKKELTPQEVKALAAARRREMSPSLPDAAVPVEVVSCGSIAVSCEMRAFVSCLVS